MTDHSASGFGVRAGLWDMFDQLRGSFESRQAPRRAKGDVRAAVLALLAEQPMHGYQIITEIAERTDGAWKPSAGSVYPTLQLLADEGLVAAAEVAGRKTYSLTDAGRDAAADVEIPWQQPTAHAAGRYTALAKAGTDLAGAVAQLARTATDEQVEEAVALLDETRRSLYAILARS